MSRPEWVRSGLLLCALALALLTGCVSATGREVRHELRASLSDSAVSVSSRAARLRPFYEKRGFAPAWIGDERLTDPGRAVLEALCGDAAHGLPVGRLEAVGDRLEAAFASGTGDDAARSRALARAELELSAAVLDMVEGRLYGRAGLPRVHENWHYDVDRDSVAPARLLERFASTRDLDETLSDFQAAHPAHQRLEEALARYREIAERGGWAPIPGRGALAADATGPRAVAVRARLAATGDLASESGDLPAAVRRFQERHGLEATGTIDEPTLAAMNVPVADRIAQLQVNLERQRWLPRLEDECVVVNIPAFELHAFRNGREALRMNVITGERMNQTPIFADEIAYISFRPYWNVPESIAMEEIVPKLREDPDYLATHGYEVVDAEGDVVDVRSGLIAGLIPVPGGGAGDLARGIEDGRLQIRQRPGPDNALGLVKFMFPNEFNVYLHHTPAEHLFAESRRDFSHGCIRVEDPVALGRFLLAGNGGWDEDRIVETMNDTTLVSKDVPLDRRVPVYIVYLTAWAGSDGRVQFRDDIYGHDARLRAGLADDSSKRAQAACARLKALVEEEAR